MNQKEIKELSLDDLTSKIVELKEQYGKMKLSHSISPLENTVSIKNSRKLIARLSTELSNRSL